MAEAAVSTMQPRLVATDLGFTEGPVWTRDETLLAVGVSRGRVYELCAKTGAVLQLYELGGCPNGLALGRQGEIWVAQAGGGDVPPSLQCIREDGTETHTNGFYAPNDVAIGPNGHIWFTDPQGEALGGHPLPGRIWSFDPLEGTFELHRSDILYPNGLAFDLGAACLYVAETATARILKYRWDEGRLGEAEIFAKLEAGYPDGLALDRHGWLYIAATTDGSVQVLDTAGVLQEVIPMSAGLVTNLCFGGSEGRSLYVTASRGGSIWSIDREVSGMPLTDIVRG